MKLLGNSRWLLSAEKGNSNCRADVLTLDGVPIAVSLIAIAGRTGFTIKSCYDEAYRSYSAGLLLEVEVIPQFPIRKLGEPVGFRNQWSSRP